MLKNAKHLTNVCLCFLIYSILSVTPYLYKSSDTPRNIYIPAASHYISSDDTYTSASLSNPYTDAKKVAITFDDGPCSLTTPRLLKGLKERNVKATFFVVGANADKNRDLIKEMYNDGHLIGNHTHTHCNLATLTSGSALTELNEVDNVIYNITGEYPDFLRPPFGECGNAIINSLNMFEVLWDIDPKDWSVQNTELVVLHVINNVSDGDIILLHDIFDTSVDAALQIVDILSERGYEFVTVDEILFP